MNRLNRASWVRSIGRWIIELAFLFTAFTEFPEHKWSIGLGFLVLQGMVVHLGHSMTVLAVNATILSDAAERKTRHCIVLAAESPMLPTDEFTRSAFWASVDSRVAAEAAAADRYADKPIGRLAGFGLAALALLWEVGASVVGIGFVMALTDK